MNILNMQGLSTEMIINPLGGLGVTSQYDKLKQDIATLLLTRRGSVIGNPSYGSTLHEHLFNNVTTAMLGVLNEEISNILVNNYNFIQDVDTNMRIGRETLTISISYSTINTNLSTKLEFNIPLNSEGGINYNG